MWMVRITYATPDGDATHLVGPTDRLEADARDLLLSVALALDSLDGAYCGDPRDWGQYKRDAWTYGIVCGWGDDEAEDGLPLVESIGRRHGWSEANIARLREYAEAVRRLTDHGYRYWPTVEQMAATMANQGQPST